MGSDSAQDPAGSASEVFLGSVLGQFVGIYRVDRSFLDRNTTPPGGTAALALLGSAGERGPTFAHHWATLAADFPGRDDLLARAIHDNVPAVLRESKAHASERGHERHLFTKALIAHEVVDRLWAVYPTEHEPGPSLGVLALRLGAARPFDDIDEWALSVLLTDLMPLVAEALRDRPAPISADIEGLRERYDGLGPRQRELLPMLMSGLSEQEIGDRVFRSRHTIHDHAKRIYAQLGVRSRVELVVKYARFVEG